jgi:hypothetical protein
VQLAPLLRAQVVRSLLGLSELVKGEDSELVLYQFECED